MMLLKELLQLREDQQPAGDPEADQAIADINRKYGAGSDKAREQIDRWKRQRLTQVTPRIRALLMQKERMNQQIDAQIAREREKGTA